MALSDAVQGARHTAQQITWLRVGGAIVDLTDATLTGFKTDQNGVTTAIDGDLTILSAAAGTFTWTYGVNDVATPGVFRVQFIATFGVGDEEKSFEMSWRVRDALEV